MRRNNSKRLGLVVGGLLAATGAQAADLPSRTIPPVFAAVPFSNIDDWSGVYVGTTFGYGFNSYRNRQGAVSSTRDGDGFESGALVGYNAQYGHFVFGVEGSIDTGKMSAGNFTPGLPPAHNESLYDIRFRGILGYEFGRFMPFIAGGAVLNESDMAGVGGIGNVPIWYGQTQQTVGYTIGAGIDYKLNPQGLFPGLPTFLLGPVTLRVEYLYQDLPTQTYAYQGQTYRTSQSGSFIRGALIYRFGDNPPRPYADAAGEVNWAGGYGGIMGGYGSPSIKNRVAGVGTQTIDADGGLGGIYAGTNFMFGRFMLGIDGSTSWTDLTGRKGLAVDVPHVPGVTDPVDYRGYIDADIRARAGYAFGNFLPFVAAGYSFSRGELIDRVTGSSRGNVPLDAFRVGGGLDYRMTQRVSLRIEDVYDLGSTRTRAELNGCACSVTRDGNTVRAGIAYHFE